jgi:hypothetical protein
MYEGEINRTRNTKSVEMATWQIASMFFSRNGNSYSCALHRVASPSRRIAIAIRN